MKSKNWPVIAFVAASMFAAPAMAEGLYGAIAFSPSTGQAGSAWNFDNKDAADTEAYLQCANPDCYTAVVFQECGALAVGDGNGMGFAADSSSSKAEEAALDKCNGFTTNCAVTSSACNDGF